MSGMATPASQTAQKKFCGGFFMPRHFESVKKVN
jgi:hypothetical protein